MQLTATHYISLAVTLLVTLLPGLLAARRVKSADDYNVGGRSSGAGLVAGTIIGTIIGGAATVGTAQLGFKLGLTAWWFTLGSGIALLLMAAFYAVPLRRSSLTTVAEFLVTDYGKPAGWLATFSACAGIFFQYCSKHADGAASHCRLVRRTAFGCSGNCYRCYFVVGVFRRPQQQRYGRYF